MRYTIHDIASILNHPISVESDKPIEHILTDSRKVYFPATSIFFALEGNHTHGHQFIESLYRQSVRYFVVPSDYPIPNYADAVFIPVEDTVKALQKLAAVHRQKFNYPVIGITGSNGKTIVKEMLYQLLYNRYKIVRSPKSFNSQLGVPLSVWQMQETDELAIFEAGISKPGEMEHLQAIIQPDLGVFTYIGTAHDQGFANKKEKIVEKLQLFRDADWLCYCADDAELDHEIKQFQAHVNPKLQLFSWGKNQADIWVINIHKRNQLTDIRFAYLQNEYAFSIPFTDDASVHNAMTCICVLLKLNFSQEEIAEKMMLLKPVAMRLEMKQGINNTVIINDSYSADVNSLQIALDFLFQQTHPVNKSLILSDILQTGEPESVLYPHLAEMLMQKPLYRFVGIGTRLMQYKHLFEGIPHLAFFPDTASFLSAQKEIHFHDEIILLKAARIFSLERFSRLLEQKQHQTVLEIDLNALRHNLWAYKQKLQPAVKMMAMVKAFSYGSGSHEVAGILQQSAVDFLGVAYTDEAVALRDAGVRLPIMVMNIEEAGFDSIIRYELQPEIFSLKILSSFRSFLQSQNINQYPVHIKLDTGMHRLGFEEKDIPELIKFLVEDTFTVVSVFSHLSGSDEEKFDAFTHQQFQLFNQMADQIEAALQYPFLKHISNSAAISRLPYLQLNMVRLGIGLYGVETNPEMQMALKNVTTLKTTIAQLRMVKKGESVGYSRAAIVDRDTWVATVRIGYADGYMRALGNGAGKMRVQGELVPVLGNVCMDMTFLDVTGIDVKEDDEVIVFGEDLPVSQVAAWAGTISYEILTGISQRVKRLYYEE